VTRSRRRRSARVAGSAFPPAACSWDRKLFASPECWQVYGEVAGFELAHPELVGRFHQLTVDAYGAQHSGGDGRGIRIAYSLVGLHLALDRGLPGPDHLASIEPDAFGTMVAEIREVERALGERRKAPGTTELRNAPIARKSLVAATAIQAGLPFTAENLAVKRPGTGRSPMDYWALLGTPATRDYAADELIDP